MSVKVESRELFYTDDLSLFKIAPENRYIRTKHVDRMAQSITKYGFLRDSPMKVIKEGTKYVITDGQHRYEAAKKLGTGVYFITTDQNALKTDIMTSHAYTKDWTLDDFLHHFVMLRKPAYETVKDLCRQFQLPVSNVLGLLNNAGVNMHRSGNTRPNNITLAFKTGDLEIDPHRLADVQTILEKANHVRLSHDYVRPFLQDRAFVAALLDIVQSDQYNEARMLDNLHRQLTRLVKCSNKTQYMRLLQDIYNFRFQAKNRVEFIED